MLYLVAQNEGDRQNINIGSDEEKRALNLHFIRNFLQFEIVCTSILLMELQFLRSLTSLCKHFCNM